jgi:hypothetical protein
MLLAAAGILEVGIFGMVPKRVWELPTFKQMLQ